MSKGSMGMFDKIRGAKGLGLRRLAAVVLGVALAQGLAACADLRPLTAQPASPRQGWWLTLDDASALELSPGVQLELPTSVYRARFEDAGGVYYQAAAPLVVRTVHGVTRVIRGGLYVPNLAQEQAQVWSYPTLGAPLIADLRPVRVRLLRAS